MHAAIEIQNAFRYYNTSIAPEDPQGRIRSKIGIHFGRILEEESGDIFGSAVDFAARIVGLCSDSQILVSETVRGLLGADFELGEGVLAPMKGLDDQPVYEVLYDEELGVRLPDPTLDTIIEKLRALEERLQNGLALPEIGILGVHPTQEPLREALERMPQGTRRLRVLAITAMKIWTNNSVIENLLSTKDELSAEILILHPDSDHIAMRSEEYGNYTRDAMRLEVRSAVEKLRSINVEAERRGGRLHLYLRHYDLPPVFRLIFIDGEAFASGYLPGIGSTRSPLYHLIHHPRSLFGYFDKLFTKTWETATEVDLNS